MTSPESAGPEQQPPVETILESTTVTVRRSPRYVNFMVLGTIVGVLAALVGTVSFPENEDFGQAQVFGFLLLIGVTLGLGVGCLIALLFDKRSSRSATQVRADRLGVQEPAAAESEEVSSDTHHSTHNSADSP